MSDTQLVEPRPLKALRRDGPIVLPEDASESAAYVLKTLQSESTAFDRSEAVNAMAARVELLRAASGDQIERELIQHATILDCLFQRLILQSVASSVPVHQQVFAGLAFKAQAAYTRILVSVEGLRQARPKQAQHAA